MTKKFKSTTPLMELDLDSFLHHHSDDDDDDDDDDQIHSSIPHRTVDDILNDSDSSSSSSPPSLKSDTVSVRSSLAAEITVTRSNSVEKRGNSDDKSGSYKYNLIQRLKSDEFSSSRRTGPSRPSSSLSSLFGGVRSSAKPGAALAAAAAASRPVPTPHAAAIKSRRAGSLNNEMLGVVKDEVFDRVSVISSGRTEGKSEGEDGDQLGEFQSALVEKSGSENGELESERGVVEISKGGVDAEKEEAQEGKLPNEEDIKKLSDQEASGSSFVAESERGSSLNNEDEFSLDKKIVMSKDYVDDNHSIAPRGADWDIVDHVGSTAPNTEVVRGSSSECKKDERVHQDSNVGTSGTQNTEKAPIGSENEAAEIIKDDLSSISDDVTELVQDRIAQLESQRIRREAEKKLRPAKKPLELAEELETKQASTGLHWEEGAAAQPMRLEGVRRGSTVLGYFDIDADNTLSRAIKSQSFRHDYGSPHVLALHPSYIAVGMSKGIVIVVPSKYSPYHPDNLDAKMLMLGAQGDRSQVPVTSICFNQQGDLLLAGYGDGHIAVWDVPKASVAKVITGEHSVPVVHAFFLGQDPQVTRQFKAITGDSKGLVLLHEFSVMPLLGRFTIKTQCLLDGQRTGTVLCASPLLPDELGGAASVASQGNMTGAAGSIGGMMGGVVAGGAGWRLFNEGATLSEEGVVIFVTHQTALVVRFSPSLEVYAQLPKPEGVREGSMPYTAWKCTTQSQNSSAETTNVEALEKISLLAIAWDRKVQVAKLVKSELKVCGKWTLESVAIGLAWLDDQMLVVITLSGQLCLYSRDGTLIHQTSYVIDGCAGDDMIAYQTHFTNVFGNPEKSYHNSLSVRGASIYILGPVHVVVSRLLPWKERVQVLRKAGDWMGALNMAMTLYDGQAHGVFDLPRSLDAVQEAIMPYLVDLLFSYVDEVFSYISVACFNQIGKMEQSDGSKSTSSSVHSEMKEQFARVGGVAVEFCVHIKRTDILFDEIFSKFVKVQQRDTFLELLEPYILKDMLGSLPPEIMQALVEHYNSKGWLQRVEQCILHMDISSLDFNQVVRLCRENGLYGALIYLFNKGLDDFRTPLEELLVVLRDSERDSATSLGYRMLVYLKYCFSGLAFPPGHGTLPSERLFSLRTELVQFLLEDSGACKSQTVTHLISMGAYLNLYFLLELDTEATLDVLRIAFSEVEIPRTAKSSLDTSDSSTANLGDAKEYESATKDQNLWVQRTVDALVLIFDVYISQTSRSGGNDDAGTGVWPSKKDIGHFIEFIASYVALKRAIISKSVLGQILEYLASEINFSQDDPKQKKESVKRREKKVLALLNAAPETEWDATYVLDLCETAEFYQVCGLIHSIRSQYLAAMDSYMKDLDEPIHAFTFINSILPQLSGTELAAFRSAIFSRIPELTNLSRECTFFLIYDHFNKESGHILSELHSYPKSLFLYLKTLVEVHLSGTLNFPSLRIDDIANDPVDRRVKVGRSAIEAYWERLHDFPSVLRNNPVEVTDDMIELYLELLCQYEPESVLKFLETFENYRVEHCLKLCQEYGIVDAAAFLLERVGDVGSALLLTLSGINGKFIMLDTAVQDVVSDVKLSHMEHFNAALGLKEVQDISKILNACVGLCRRNTPRLDPEESESLWFYLLDSFCKPLMISEGKSDVRMLEKSLDSKLDEENSVITWRIPRDQPNSPTLKRLFSHFIKEVVEGMIGYVRLPSIMSKLLSDNGSQEFGDFKLTILGMLGTYGFERRLLDTAKSVVEDDTFYNMSLLKKGASKAYAPRSLVCCLCNCPFNKTSSSSGIRLFNCGHATHLQCEIGENASSHQNTYGGCPVCAPKKKIQKSKGKMVYQGLVNVSSSRPRHSRGNGIQHLHEVDAFETTHGLNQMSRFELLTNLQKNPRLVQIEPMPQLRLAPPAIYHEKVKKGTSLLLGEGSSDLTDAEKPSRNKQIRDLKVKGSSIRFPLTTRIFGKEKTRTQ